MNFVTKISRWFFYRLHPRHRTDRVKTHLPAGYYDKDKMLLYSCFSILSDFVENESAWLCLILNEKEKDKVPWYMSREMYRKKHARRLGLDYSSDDQEIVELYKWWKDMYPNRIDPFNDLRFRKFDDIDILDKMKDKDYTQLCESAAKIVDKYYKEDTDMLVRLMQVRERLWT